MASAGNAMWWTPLPFSGLTYRNFAYFVTNRIELFLLHTMCSLCGIVLEHVASNVKTLTKHNMFLIEPLHTFVVCVFL